MPVSAKIFLYVEDLELPELHKRLKGWREVELYEVPDERFDLLTNIEELHYDEEELVGVYKYDRVAHHSWRGVDRWTPFTVEAPFLFTEQEGRRFVIILAPKDVANRAANMLSMILHEEQGTIVEPTIRSDSFNEFRGGTEATKIMLFDDIEIPNMDKTTLYGDNVAQTDFYGNLVGIGRPRYMVGKTKKRGWTVGIVRDAAIVVFNTVDEGSFIEFLKDKILPMTYRRSRR
jgi:hypothetical protein